MDTMIKEINDNLKTILDTIRENRDNSISTLDNIQNQMDKKVEEAKKYKIQVDSAKDRIRELENLFCLLEKAKKSRRRPTLARASPALPSAMEPLTSVFGMGTGMTAPPWPPAKKPQAWS